MQITKYIWEDIIIMMDGHVLGLTEPIFTLTMKTFNMLNFKYEQFLVIISFIILLMYFIIIKKSTKYACFVIAIYFIFPFCMDVCQLRFSMATIFSTLGLYFLLFEKNKRKSILKYIICICIAGLIHFAMFFMLILVIPKLLNIKQTIVITIISIVVLQILIVVFPNITFLGDSILTQKINFVLDYSNQKYNIWGQMNTIYRIIVFFALYLILNRIVARRITKQKERVEDYNKKIEVLNLVLKINIMILIIIPLISIMSDIYRVQTTLSLINIITYSYFFIKQEKGKINLYNFIFILACVVFNLVNLNMLVLRNTNLETVFLPLFNNNLLL